MLWTNKTTSQHYTFFIVSDYHFVLNHLLIISILTRVIHFDFNRHHSRTKIIYVQKGAKRNCACVRLFSESSLFLFLTDDAWKRNVQLWFWLKKWKTRKKYEKYEKYTHTLFIFFSTIHLICISNTKIKFIFLIII